MGGICKAVGMSNDAHLTSTGRRIVVAGALIRDGLLLAARRSSPVELAGKWELPGGKVEVGELPIDAIRRELREELAIDVEVVGRLMAPSELEDAVGGDWPLSQSTVLRVYLVDLVHGDPSPGPAHDEVRWLGSDHLMSVSWLPADSAPIQALGSRLTSGPAR